MISTEIPKNFARKELTTAQFQRRCNRLLTQKLVRFNQEEKKEILAISKNSNISDGFEQLTNFLKDNFLSVSTRNDGTLLGERKLSDEGVLHDLKNMLKQGQISPEKATDIWSKACERTEKIFRYFNAIVYKPSTTPEIIEIEKNLRKKSVKAKFSDKTSVDFARLTEEALKDFVKKGYDIPKKLCISPLIGIFSNGQIISAGKPAKTIFLNSELAHKCLKDIKKEVKSDYADRFNSTNNPKKTIYHESIHWLHSQNNGIGDLFVKWFSTFARSSKHKSILSPEENRYLENFVSKYAKSDEKGLEAVAEIGTGLMDGKKYTRRILALYARLKGPIPNQN